MHICTRIAAVAFLFGGAITTFLGPTPASAGGSAPGTVRLTIVPRCLSIRAHQRSMVVTLSGVRPRSRYVFTESPDRPGFGGGEMGVHRSNSHGVVRFVYPGPSLRWEAGTWTVTASRIGGGAVAKGTYTVMRGSCLATVYRA